MQGVLILLLYGGGGGSVSLSCSGNSGRPIAKPSECYLPYSPHNVICTTLSLTSAPNFCGWSIPRPGRFTAGKEMWYISYRRLHGLQGRPGRVRKHSPQQRLDPRTVQPVASRCTDWAMPAQKCTYTTKLKLKVLKHFVIGFERKNLFQRSIMHVVLKMEERLHKSSWRWMCSPSQQNQQRLDADVFR
jgi:hypothetical protein